MVDFSSRMNVTVTVSLVMLIAIISLVIKRNYYCTCIQCIVKQEDTKTTEKKALKEIDHLIRLSPLERGLRSQLIKGGVDFTLSMIIILMMISL